MARNELLANIPFASTAYKMWKGNWGGAAGDIAGLGVLGAAGKGVSVALRPMEWNEPEINMVKAQGPPKTDVGYTRTIRPTMEDIKQYGNAGKNIKTNSELIDASQRGMDHAMTELDGWKAGKRPYGAFIDSSPLVDASTQAISPDMWRENPQQARAVIEPVRQAYAGRRLTVDEGFDLLAAKNNQLAAFSSKSPAAQQAAITAGTPQAVLEAQVEALREMLYNALDPENGGAGPREIQTRYGLMKDVRDYAQLRTTDAATKGKATSTLGALGRTASTAKDILNPMHGNTAEALESLSAPWRGLIDPLIERAFRSISPARPIPKPGASFWPVGGPAQPGPATLLTTGDVITPPPTDTSGGGMQPLAPHQAAQTMRRALPSGTSPFTQGIVVPDIWGRAKATGAHPPALPQGPQPVVGGPRITGMVSPSTPAGGINVEMPSEAPLRVSNAKRVVIKDPETGKETVYYTSAPELPKKKGGVVVPERNPEVDRLLRKTIDRDAVLRSLKGA
jgi:hypothetical protein